MEAQQHQNTHQHGVNAYRQTSQQVQDTGQAMAQVFARMSHRLQEGRAAYQARQLDVMCHHHQKLIESLILLGAFLKVDEDAEDLEAARASLRFHQQSCRESLEDIANVLLAPEPLLVFERVDERFRTLYHAWAKAK